MGFSVISRHLFLTYSAILLLQFVDGDNIRLPDQVDPQRNAVPHQQQPLYPAQPEERRQGKHLLDFVGLGTGNNVDPFLARTNANCLNGELAECFKSQAIGYFTDFFSKDVYHLTENARVIRLPEQQLRSLEHEGYEYSSESRASDSEWDQLVKFALRKVEKFMKSTAIELQIPEEITEGGRYSPRFIDEISDEIDVIEDKKAPLFSRNRLKKIFVPLLIILKIFKLKLLLFLPLILGLASFKKLLGFLAIIIPGVIGYFKLCRPNIQSNYGNLYSGEYQPQYSPQGLGLANYLHSSPGPYNKSPSNYYHREEPSFAAPYGNYYSRDNAQGEINSSSNVRFGADDAKGQDLAYQGYSEYRNKNTETQAAASA